MDCYQCEEGPRRYLAVVCRLVMDVKSLCTGLDPSWNANTLRDVSRNTCVTQGCAVTIGPGHGPKLAFPGASSYIRTYVCLFEIILSFRFNPRGEHDERGESRIIMPFYDLNHQRILVPRNNRVTGLRSSRNCFCLENCVSRRLFVHPYLCFVKITLTSTRRRSR